MKKIENDDLEGAYVVKKKAEVTDQLDIFDAVSGEVVDELRSMDVTTFTPIEAMNKLYELSKKVKD